MKIKSLSEIEQSEVKMEGVKNTFKQVPISKEDGSPGYTFRVFTVKPGGNTPYHQHNFEHVNYIIGGEGALVNEDGEEQGLMQGDFALVLPNEKHQYKNVSPDKDFVMICAVPNEYE